MTFRVGMKVVCVDVSIFNAPSLGTLRKGGIYTIRWIGIELGQPCVKVVEIIRPCRTDFLAVDTPFLARRFRPVVERKTDITIFQRMLTPTGVNA